MNPLLLDSFANFVSVENRKLVITNKIKNTRQEYYIHNLPFDNLVLTSHTGNISWEAIRFLVRHEVTITTLSWNGSLLSVTLPAAPASAKLRLKQYEAYLDTSKKYHIAYTIVKQKISLQLELLKELSKYYELDMDRIEKSFSAEERFYAHESIDAAMTMEGRCADRYWNAVIKVVDQLYPEFHFKSRNNEWNSHNRNASDPVSSLFNYAYSIVESEVRRVINYVGLDGSIPYLHNIQDGRQSLTYDIQELYRWIADLSVIKLLEEHKLKVSDWIVTDNYTYRLKEKTARMLINKIKETMNQRALYKESNCTYQNILFDNVRILAKYILSKQEKLKFNIPPIQIKRNDELPLRDRILSITPEQRKKLGIRKNTLWYMQKHIREGRKIKIYKKVMMKI